MISRFNKGFDPKRGKGGFRKNAGRKPDEFKIWIRTLANSPAARLRFEKILTDAPDADIYVTAEGVSLNVRANAMTYLRAYEVALNYDQGKPLTRTETTVLNINRGTPEDSKRNADEIYQGIKKLEEDALNSRPPAVN